MARRQGFTLIELLVVLAIVASLLTLAVPRYFASLDRAGETTLRQDLAVMREAIDRYYGDTGRYPDSLQALVEQRYLRAVPVDPVGGATAEWVTVPPPPGLPGRVGDVASAAQGSGRNGVPYAQW